jgi:DNA-binding response OmpR family regulator
MGMRILVLSDEKSMRDKLEQFASSMKVKMDIFSMNEVEDKQFICYDVICVIEGNQSVLENNLRKLKVVNKSFTVVIFTDDLSKEALVNLFGLGANIISLNDLEVITMQMEQLFERNIEYISPVMLGGLSFDPGSRLLSMDGKNVSLN